LTLDPAVVIAAIGALSAALGRAAWMIYGDLRRDRDYWRDMALELRDINRSAIGVAEKAAKRA
jgi:hypothetical protein